MRSVGVAFLLLLQATIAGAQATVDIRMASWQPGAAAIVYPAMLASAPVVGVVDVRFVVDTLGRVDTSSIAIMKSTHELFSRSARDAVIAGRATRALVNRVPRSQLVIHRFVFAPSSEPVCVETSPPVAARVTLVCAPKSSGPPRSEEVPRNPLLPPLGSAPATPLVPRAQVRRPLR